MGDTRDEDIDNFLPFIILLRQLLPLLGWKWEEYAARKLRITHFNGFTIVFLVLRKDPFYLLLSSNRLVSA